MNAHLRSSAGARRASVAVLAFASVAAVLPAQIAPAAAESPVPKEDGVVTLGVFNVTGSNLRRLEQEKALPVTVIDREAMEVRDALTPVQMLTALPQVVGVPINESNSTGAVARGDIASISLRGLGSGNTLVLLNGRRLANHPITQNESGVLASSVNVNQLPNRGVARIELLRDGASSVYGSDAVAGVVNYLMDTEFRGTELSLQFGWPERGGAEQVRATLTHGIDFADGRGHFLAVFDAYEREALYLAERSVSADANKTGRVPPPFNAAFSPFFDRNASGPYASFRISSVPAFLTGTATATRYLVPLASGGVGFTASTPPRSGVTADYYYNINADQMNLPATERANLFARADYDVTERLSVFAELSYYDAFSDFRRSPLPYSSGADRLLVLAAANPYNPFGSRFFDPNGAPNPDGSPRLAGIPQPTTILNKRIMDMGQERVEIDTDIVRILAGVRGRLADTWTWEAAAYHTRARTTDEVQNALRESRLLEAAQRSDATAFNPFGYTFRVAGAAVVVDQPYVNPPAVMGPIHDKLPNVGESSLRSIDLRASGELWQLWAGPVTVSVGGEYREEELSHTRPPFAGLNPASSGLDPTNNDFIQASPTADIVGDRQVASAYAETVIPLAAPANSLPLLTGLDLTAAVRFESYSDFGETTKPKFGVNWRPARWLMVRGSYNEGFRAPNLAVLNQLRRQFVQAYADPIRVAVTGLPTDGTVNRTYSTAGNSALQPEFSKGRSVGVVVDVPGVKGLSFSADWWKIEQSDIIDADTTAQVLNNDAALIRAYTAQQVASGTPVSSIDLGSGTANYRGDPRVTRAPMPAQDIPLFDAYNASRPPAEQLPYFGPVTSLATAFSNRSLASVSGVDLGITWRIPEQSFGRVTVATEWTYLDESFITAPNSATRNSRLGQDGAARWRGNASVTWRRGHWAAGVGAYYVGEFADTGASTTAAVYDSLGRPEYIDVVFDNGRLNYYLRVADALSFNAHASYRMGRERGRWLRETTVRLGVTNLTDEEPPLSSAPSGYHASVYNYLALGRTWTLELTRRF